MRLTSEPFPRLTVVREVRDEQGAAWLGPFSSTAAARSAVEALHEALPVRECTRRLPLRPAPDAAACLLLGLGRCGAPCTGAVSVDEYAQVAQAVRAAMLEDPAPVVDALAARIRVLVGQERFEEAADVRDRLQAFLRGAVRAQRCGPLARCPELVAAHRLDDGGWEVVLVRYGRLAGTARVDRHLDPRPVVETLQATAEHVPVPVAPAGAAHPEETDLVLTWLEQPGVRLVEMTGEWTCPVRSAQRVDAVTAVAIELAAPRGGGLVPAGGAPAVVVPVGRVRADDGTRRTA